jgi:hypothetical protein
MKTIKFNSKTFKSIGYIFEYNHSVKHGFYNRDNKVVGYVYKNNSKGFYLDCTKR